MQEYCKEEQPFIIVKRVSYAYPKGGQVLKSISMSLYRNEFTAIIGPNGSGKTTLGKLLTGIFQPTVGQVFLAEQETRFLTLGAIGQKVGYLFQEPERQIFAPSVREELSFALDFRGVPAMESDKKVDQMLRLFHLEELKGEFPFYLSRGEKQRLALAAILMNEPDFLILDEPTTGLDLQRRVELATILQEAKKRGLGLVVISHDEDFVKENADRVIELAGGEIIADYYT